jgi:hypothetical protein
VTVAGAWRVEADTSAAEGRRLRHPDAGAPKLTTALAAPANFVEFAVDVEAGTPYRVWIRGRADRDSYTNDSVFLQFSDTISAAGPPVFRIGTTSATPVILEDCTNCRPNGWGWQDNGYGAGVLGPLLTFKTGARQMLRIQTREDGLAIDQIVLSPERYLTTPPGLVRGDTTILP